MIFPILSNINMHAHLHAPHWYFVLVENQTLTHTHARYTACLAAIMPKGAISNLSYQMQRLKITNGLLKYITEASKERNLYLAEGRAILLMRHMLHGTANAITEFSSHRLVHRNTNNSNTQTKNMDASIGCPQFMEHADRWVGSVVNCVPCIAFVERLSLHLTSASEHAKQCNRKLHGR